MHIKKNDTVVVISGEYKGRRGRVLRVYPKKNSVLVEGVNIVKRHTKPTSRNQQGGIVEREAPIQVSKVRAWCEAVNGPSRIVMRRLEDGTRVRMYRANDEMLTE